MRTGKGVQRGLRDFARFVQILVYSDKAQINRMLWLLHWKENKSCFLNFEEAWKYSSSYPSLASETRSTVPSQWWHIGLALPWAGWRFHGEQLIDLCVILRKQRGFYMPHKKYQMWKKHLAYADELAISQCLGFQLRATVFSSQLPVVISSLSGEVKKPNQTPSHITHVLAKPLMCKSYFRKRRQIN